MANAVNRPRLITALFAAACLLQGGIVHALQICNSNIPASTANLIDNGDGTVTHPTTGLMWKLCSEGYTYSGPSSCLSSASTLQWAAALVLAKNTVFASYSDWRLPNYKELQSLREAQCTNPAINTSIFPAGETMLNVYWASTTDKSNPADALGVDFSSGSSDISVLKNGSAYVRLVRGGAYFNSFDASATYTPGVTPVFAGQSGVVASTPQVSATYTASGLTTITGINVTGTGATYTVNGVGYNNKPAIVKNGDPIVITLVSSATAGATKAASVSLGGYVTAFNVVTAKSSIALNDSGVGLCYDDTTSAACSTVAVDGGSHPRQDARIGRDAAAGVMPLTKAGAGDQGFDYTKIDKNGSDLASGVALGNGPTDWACTRDNNTGLIWEVKQSVADLSNFVHTYTWYNSVNNYQGNAGTPSSGSTCFTNGRCDTEKFIADVNAVNLCGLSNWRLPTLKELRSLVNHGQTNPAIDPTYFPNTQTNNYLTNTAYANDPTAVWGINFATGIAGPVTRSVASNVRLVSDGP